MCESTDVRHGKCTAKVDCNKGCKRNGYLCNTDQQMVPARCVNLKWALIELPRSQYDGINVQYIYIIKPINIQHCVNSLPKIQFGKSFSANYLLHRNKYMALWTVI
jgi:hypothetical protein